MRLTHALTITLLAAAPAFAAPTGRTDDGLGGLDRLDDLARPDLPDNPTILDRMKAADVLEEQRDAAGRDEDWQSDPFVHLNGLMDGIAEDLGRNQTGQPVQDEQTDVVSKIDVLIEALQQAGGGGGGGQGQGQGQMPGPKSANPSSPMSDSMISDGPGGSGEMKDPGNSNRDWADLPPRDREKILQSKDDGFPSGFEGVLGEYYRGLAEEQPVGDDAGPGAAPADTE